MAARDEIEIAGVRLTSPDKVLYPEQGITKRDLANYMVAVGDWMLPHVAKRPITLVRCPTGRQKKCFYQRHAGSGVPKELGEIAVPGFEEPYLFVRDVRGLIALVQMGVLEIHPWGATNDRPDRPDRMIFDLDPGEGLAFADVVAAAREVRAMLELDQAHELFEDDRRQGLASRCANRPPLRLARGEGFRAACSRQARERETRALSHPHVEGGAARTHPHRLFTQRSDLDSDCALFDALA